MLIGRISNEFSNYVLVIATDVINLASWKEETAQNIVDDVNNTDMSQSIRR